jgi:hypothetical protein
MYVWMVVKVGGVAVIAAVNQCSAFTENLGVTLRVLYNGFMKRFTRAASARNVDVVVVS